MGAGPHLSRVCLELSVQVSPVQEQVEICMQTKSAQAAAEDKKNPPSPVTFGFNSQTMVSELANQCRITLKQSNVKDTKTPAEWHR